jgi:hypothetical protein
MAVLLSMKAAVLTCARECFNKRPLFREPPYGSSGRGGDRDGYQKRKRSDLCPFPDRHREVPSIIVALHIFRKLGRAS